MKRLTVLALAAVFAFGTFGCKKKLLNVAALADGGLALGDAGATTTTAASDGTVTFTKKDPTVGSKRSEDTKTEMTLKMVVMKKKVSIAETDSTKKDEEVQEVSAGAITKVKVTYNEDTKTTTDDKGTKTKATPVVGKTYTVASSGGKVTVQNDKGQTPPKPESSIVDKGYSASLGKPDPMIAAISPHGMKAGEDCPELADALTKSMKAQSKDDKTAIDGAKVTFRGKDGDNGNFDVELTMRGDAGFMKMLMPLKGKMVVRIADSWPVSLSLEGPIEVDSGGAKNNMVEGEGTIKITSNFSYK